MRAVYDAQAPAKINLWLHVVGRRADGLHLLQSVFRLVDWSDTLHYERRDDGLLRRHDLGDPLPVDDLCLRAARALQARAPAGCGADISILKRVPSAAGMGGGSSDAATTLLVLNRLWGLDLPRPALSELALGLGADVPFFIGGANAFVEGVGERLAPLEVPPERYAIVKPPGSAETRAVFASPLVVRDTPAILCGFSGQPSAGAAGAGGPLSVGFGRNDLQAACESQCPDVASAARWLEGRFGNSRMTGSGSAVFARITEDDVRHAGTGGRPEATELADLPAGWVGRMCRGLPHHPMREWAVESRRAAEQAAEE